MTECWTPAATVEAYFRKAQSRASLASLIVAPAGVQGRAGLRTEKRRSAEPRNACWNLHPIPNREEVTYQGRNTVSANRHHS
jgi:hypothetical protein